MKHIAPRKAEGKTLKRVYLADQGWKAVKVNTKVPPGSKLFNFEVKDPKSPTSWLVLDPYGDETLLGKVRDRIFGGGSGRSILVVDQTTGLLYLGTFMVEKKVGITLVISSVFSLNSSRQENYRVPKSYLPRLGELLSMKRPYNLTVRDNALVGFIDQDIGFSALSDEVIVKLQFSGVTLEVWGDSHREVSDWKRCD